MVDAEIQDVFANCLPALANLKAGVLEESTGPETNQDSDMQNRGKRSRQETPVDKPNPRQQQGKGKGGQRSREGNWERGSWEYNGWRPQRRPQLEQLVEALCRLTLKQEEELQPIRTEKQFLLHLESGPQGLLSPPWKSCPGVEGGQGQNSAHCDQLGTRGPDQVPPCRVGGQARHHDQGCGDSQEDGGAGMGKGAERDRAAMEFPAVDTCRPVNWN